MRHRLIMVSGTSPGAGKSTVSTLLAQALTQRDIANHLLSEDDLLQRQAFAQLDQELSNNDICAINTFMMGIRTLVAEAADTDRIWVTDALLPGFFWLLGRYPLTRVEAFRDDLAHLMHPLQPLIVYLDGNAKQFFARAVMDRGTAWGERMATAIQRWSLPHYPDGPVQDVDDTVQFLRWLNQLTHVLLAGWPNEVLLVDALQTPVDKIMERLLRSIQTNDENIAST